MKKIIIFATVFVLLTALKVNAGFTDIIEDTNIYSGSYDAIRVFDSANLDFYGDSVGLLDFRDTSTGSFHGGTAEQIDVATSAVVHLWGGQIYSMYSYNIVHLYGQGITIEPSGTGTYDRYIHGLWGDGTPFDFVAYRAVLFNSQFVIHEIPEPSTISLLLFGILGVKKLRRQKKSA